jgi:hypothetical protein
LNRILKIGLIGLGLSALSALVLTILTWVGISHFGPCGPDPLGLAFFLGALAAGAIGTLFTIAGLLGFGIRKLRGHPTDYPEFLSIKRTSSE